MTLPRGARLAGVLWIVFAIVAWNVVFDRVIVVAGRNYVTAAFQADRDRESPILIAAWMPPAVDRALWSASVVAGTIAMVGLGSLAWAVRSSAPAVRPDGDSSSEEIACAPPPIR